MKHQSKTRQRGISFIGLVFVAVVLASAGVVAAQIFPTAVEYLAIQKGVERAAAGQTVAEVRSIFEKSMATDDIKSITAKDLEVTKEGEKVVVAFAYEREIHLFGPGYLTLKYQGRSK